MILRNFLFAIGLSAVTTGAFGQITTYSARSSFTTNFPGLPVETFEEVTVRFSGLTDLYFIMPNSLDKATQNSAFLPGEILDGIRISAGTISGIIIPNIVVASPGVGRYGFTSSTISYVYRETSPSALTLDFYNGNVTEFGLDLASTAVDPFNDLTVNLFSGATNIGTFLVTDVPRAGVFFGASSASVPITRVTFDRTVDRGDFFSLDNITFGGSAASPVPEPGAYALFGAAFLLGGIVLRRMRSKKA